MPRMLTFASLDLDDDPNGPWVRRVRDKAGEWPDIALPGALSPAGQATSLAYFDEHFPELIPYRDRLSAAIDRPGAAAILTHTGLRSPFSGCSQTSVGGALIRNYDFTPDLCDRTIVRSHLLRPVIGMGDLLWGMLDGMNDAGLAVSLTYGGRPVFGEGFTVLLLVRYLLETCTTVDEAWAVIRRFPACTAQNLTIVDGEGAMTVFIGPDRAAGRSDAVCATNHQDLPVAEEQERESATGRRFDAITRVTAAAVTAEDPVESVVTALLAPPLYQSHDWGTLYTAAYRPAEGRVSYHWPQDRIEQSFREFHSGEFVVAAG